MMHHQIHLGEHEGLIFGLKNNYSLFDLSKESELKGKSLDYYIGYGYGFNSGLRIRRKIEKTEINYLTFENNIEYYTLLVERLLYSEKRIKIQSEYLKNITNWGTSNIPESIFKKSLSELENHRIQRAIEVINSFCFENYYLKLLKDNNEFKQKLKEIRNTKRQRKNYDTKIEINEFCDEFRNFIIKIKNGS